MKLPHLPGLGKQINLPARPPSRCLLAMIRLSAHDGMDTVELLEQDDEGELVLEGESAQSDDMIRAASELRSVPVGSADENSNSLHRIHLPALNPADKVGSGPDVAAFVEDEAHGTLARREKRFAIFDPAKVFPVGLQFESSMTTEASSGIPPTPALAYRSEGLPMARICPLHASNFLIEPTCNGRSGNARWPSQNDLFSSTPP